MAGVTLIPSPPQIDRDAAAPSPGPFVGGDVDGGIRPRRVRVVAAAATEDDSPEDGEGPVPIDAVRLLGRCDAIRLRGRHRRP